MVFPSMLLLCNYNYLWQGKLSTLGVEPEARFIKVTRKQPSLFGVMKVIEYNYDIKHTGLVVDQPLGVGL